MKKISSILNEFLTDFTINVEKDAPSKFDIYSDMLIEWNEKMNLTAITEPEEIAVKHFLDSLILLKCQNFKKGCSVIDVGTGAGFPGVPLKIARPDINLTLLDGLNKRLIFLNELLKKLNLDAKTVHMRAEEAGQQKNFRESFDLALSRAVAPLNVLSEYCLPLVKVGGGFISQKGPNLIDEVKASQNAIEILGGKLQEIKKVELPGNNVRNIVLIEKIKSTPDKYPRHNSQIKKKLL